MRTLDAELAGRGPTIEAWSLPVLTAAAAAVGGLLIVLPLLLNAYLPFEDLPNHIARRHMIAGADPALAAHFQLQGGLGTNAAVDMAWQIRMWFAPVSAQDAIAFSHWAIGFAMLGFVASVMILHRVLHGHWSPWPLLAGLLVYNGNVLWGFENFVVTLPLGILGFALWIAARRAAPLLRLALTLGVVAALHLGHVLVLLAYAILVFGYEGGRVWRPGRNGRTLDLRAPDWLGVAVITAACLMHLLLSVSAPAPGYGTTTSFGPLSERVQIILSPFGAQMMTGSLLQPLIDQSIALLCILVILWVLAGRVGATFLLASSMRGPLLLLGLVTLLMPVQLSGVYFTHLRFPVLLFGVLIAASDLKPIVPRASAFVGCLVLALLSAIAVRSYVLDRASRAYSEQITALTELAGVAGADMPAGARVLPVVGQQTDPVTTRHFHTAAYLVPLAEVFVPTLFVGGSHSLGMVSAKEHLSAPQPSAVPAAVLELPANRWSPAFDESWAFARGWTLNYSHVLLIGSVHDEFASQFGLQLLAQEGTKSIFFLEDASDRNDELPSSD